MNQHRQCHKWWIELNKRKLEPTQILGKQMNNKLPTMGKWSFDALMTLDKCCGQMRQTTDNRKRMMYLTNNRQQMKGNKE
jgi:hypothetical protein